MREPTGKGRHGLVLAGLALAFTATNAQQVSKPAAPSDTSEGAAVADGPRIVVDEPLVDVGEVVRGESATGQFTVRNAGTETLRIQRVKPG
jgi:hypothetical protein